MINFQRYHHAAMNAFDEFEAATKRGDKERAVIHLAHSLERETKAAKGVPDGLEPTRSIFFRSAATIAIVAGKSAEAHQLALEGLKGNPPDCIKIELLEILWPTQDKVADPDPWCSMCGKTLLKGENLPECAKCKQWWIDNPLSKVVK